MDRLLTQEEALEASLQDKENGLDIITIYLKAQDTKTASLVAQEIFKDLDHLISTCYTDHIQEYYAIKSKWGIEC